MKKITIKYNACSDSGSIWSASWCSLEESSGEKLLRAFPQLWSYS